MYLINWSKVHQSPVVTLDLTDLSQAWNVALLKESKIAFPKVSGLYLLFII